MAYRSLGLKCSQDEIWSRIALGAVDGQRSVRTSRLAADALGRRLSALTLQARDPWTALRRGADHGLRMILNQRGVAGSASGHFTVLVAIDERTAVLHDPELGPDRQLGRSTLLSLWSGDLGHPEITGNVFVALAASPAKTPACSVCWAPIPTSIACPQCQTVIVLEPAVALGCVDASCAGRSWSKIFCPECDAGIRELGSVAAHPGGPSAGTGPVLSSMDLAKQFASDVARITAEIPILPGDNPLESLAAAREVYLPKLAALRDRFVETIRAQVAANPPAHAPSASATVAKPCGAGGESPSEFGNSEPPAELPSLDERRIDEAIRALLRDIKVEPRPARTTGRWDS
jgi:hypothetical protein